MKYTWPWAVLSDSNDFKSRAKDALVDDAERVAHGHDREGDDAHQRPHASAGGDMPQPDVSQHGPADAAHTHALAPQKAAVIIPGR